MLPAVAAARVPVTAAQDLQSVLSSYAGESIRDSVSWLEEHVFDVDRRDIFPDHVFIMVLSSSFHSYLQLV